MENVTKKLYEQDSYCRSFRAKVLSCELNDGVYDVVLDESAFFPEGGGQKGDVGKIGDAEVSDTRQIGNSVVHKVSSPITVGEEVTCELDWSLRFSRMQNHSAEHIVSGVTFSKYGGNNIGFHMGDRFMSVDFDCKLNADEVKDIEIASNKAVYDNISVTVLFPTAEEIPDLQYRSKKKIDGQLRLVKIGDIDFCACCAPHVAKTGEIGLIKVIDFYPHKSGTRLEITAGFEALRDYSSLNEKNKAIMELLSLPRDEVAEGVDKLLKELVRLTKEKQSLENELSFAGLQLNKVGNNGYAFCDNASFDSLRYCSNKLVEQGTEVCMLFSEKTDGEFIYVINSKSTAIAAMLKKLNNSLSGRGGGSAQYAQGKLSAKREDILLTASEILLDE